MIFKYTLENQANIKEIDYWISFFHKSHEGFYYYVLNNGIVGIIYEDIEDAYKSIQLIFNEKEDEFYEIKLKENQDIITNYSTDKCPKELKEKFDKFLKYHNKIQQAICDYKNKFCNEENSVIKFQNSSYYSLNRNSFSSISSISDHSLLDYYSFESFDSFKNRNEVIYKKIFSRC